MVSYRKKIGIVATIPLPLLMFMKPHIKMLAEQYDVTLITNGTEQELSSLLSDSVRLVSVNIAREIALWRDVVALFRLYFIFRRERFDVVHSLMPKTGLLAMLAAFTARVPHRIHTFTGQVWANKTGFARWGLKSLDKLIASCATDLLADSLSQRQFLIAEQVVNKSKILVLGNGSICGVDTQRFRPNLIAREQLRSSLGIGGNSIVYLFLGRLTRDKGIADLAQAFVSLADEVPDAHLLVVGPDESGMEAILQSILAKHAPQFHRIGFTHRPEDYMACADIFCLPSYREGFGSVIIEAAAVGVPAVASNIYGLTDAVSDGVTGILHPAKNIVEIKRALLSLTNDANKRAEMSRLARLRAYELFATDVVVAEMRNYYRTLLNQTIQRVQHE
jgi:glycosyltransferase involved in cell wall biosynthesis